jgi:heme-degrading monooxygenase HmoA
MIARIGYFGRLTPEQEAASEFNFRERFKAALTAQDGFIAAYWLRRPEGRFIALSVWESEEHMRVGGMRANAVPLLPGQVATQIAEPESVEVCHVMDRA